MSWFQDKVEKFKPIYPIEVYPVEVLDDTNPAIELYEEPEESVDERTSPPSSESSGR